MTEIALIIDTETTGLKDPVMVEYGEMNVGFYIDSELYEWGTGTETFSQRYNPLKPIEFGAMASHFTLPLMGVYQISLKY